MLVEVSLEEQEKPLQGKKRAQHDSKNKQFQHAQREQGRALERTPREGEREFSRLGELREQRDAANREVRLIAARNKSLIAEFKQLMAKADAEKKARDRENEIVKKLVEEKKALEQEISVLKKAYLEKKKEIRELGEFKEDPERLQKQIEELEWEQQTEAVSAKKERELSKKINELRARLPKTEKATALFKEARELRLKLREKIEESRKKSGEIGVHAKASDEHHATRIACFKKAEALEQKIGETFKELDAKRGEAEAQHAELIAVRDELRRREESEEAREKSVKRAVEAKIRAKLSEQAKKLYAEFKAGRKLNLDELLLLQEAGVL